MSLFKIAVLEDDLEFLKALVDDLKRTKLVEIVAHNHESTPFIEDVKKKTPDALMLDIKLAGDVRNGIDVAALLKLPTIFFTGAKKEYTDQIESLRINPSFPPIEEYNKLPDEERLKIILKKFIPIVKAYQKTKKVSIKPIGEDPIYISPTDVVFIVADDGNHKLYFINRNPVKVADKSFEYFEGLGFDKDCFYKLNQSALFNISLARYENKTLSATFRFDDGSDKTKKFPVPDKINKEVKSLFTK